MIQSGDIKASTRKVPIPVLLLAVHALSTTLLCLTGTYATSTFVVNDFGSELCLLVFAVGAFHSSFPRHTSSAAHPILRFLVSQSIVAQSRLRQLLHPMMALSQAVQ